MTNTPKGKSSKLLYDIATIKETATGRWLEILTAAGIPSELLDGKGHPCPQCVGTDRFAAFKDVAERGAVICRKCFDKGGGDGLATVAWIRGCDLTEAIQWVADYLSVKPSRKRRVTNGKRHGRTYPTARDAVVALDSFIHRNEQGINVAEYPYHDAEGDHIATVIRYNLPTPEGEKQRKTFRPVSKYADGWRLCDPLGKWPLYRLPDLAGADRVYICEGERAADAARAIGLTATTSAHGSQSPEKTDWTHLAGKEAINLPDNDESGWKYVDAVAAILFKLTPSPVVKQVELPGLEEHGDIVDWLDARDAVEPGELRQHVLALGDAAEPIPLNRTTRAVPRFQPFPTDALPELMRRFVVAGANAIGCDPSYLGLPMLCGLAGAVGATRRVTINTSWQEPCILWGAIVGESGSQKTPAQETALRPLEDSQAWQIEQLPELQRQYESDKVLYESDKKDWHSKGRKKGDPPPELPQEPSVPRYIVGDLTIEALADRLHENPRGLLVVHDELSSWLGGMDRYRSGQGRGEVGQWLSMHCGGRLLVDRKTGTKKTIFVRRAAVSIIGGITPGAFRRAIGGDHMENGLAARLLAVMPPRRPKRWKDAEVSQSIEKRISRLYARLLALDFTTNADDLPSPVDLPLEPNALALFSRFVNEHGQQQLQHEGHLASVWSKLEAAAARLALLFALCRWADGEIPADCQEPVSVEDMKAGITLARWFGNEWQRLFGAIYESDDDRDQRRLIEWIERKGGSVTAREVQQGHRQFQTSSDAEAVLQKLVTAGAGNWEPTPQGQRGQPTQRFVLSTASTVYSNTLDAEENTNTVDVDRVDASKIHAGDEWGEL